MPFSDPQSTHNPATDTVAPASWGDAVRDAAVYLATDRPHVLAHHDANQSVNNDTSTTLAFNSERFDVGGCHSTVTNNSRLTVPSGEGGRYLIGANIEFAADADGYRQVLFVLNGTTTIGGHRGPGGATVTTIVSTVVPLYTLAAGDYVEVVVRHTAGAAINVITSDYSPHFWLEWRATS